MSIHYFWLSSSNLSIIGLAYVSLIVKSPNATLYRKSLLASLNDRDIFKQAGIQEQIEAPIGSDTFLSIPSDVSSWERPLLSEFLEDIYWIVVGKSDNGPDELTDTVVKMLAEALAATYENLQVGDPAHPAPHLRILVAMHYLCGGNQQFIDKCIATFVGNGEDIFGLTLPGLDHKLAGVIASVCQEVLNDQNAAAPWLYATVVTPLEREIAGKILNGTKLSDISLPLTPKPPELNNLEVDQDFITRINAIQKMDKLLAVEFTTDDLHPRGGRSGRRRPTG